MRLQIREPLWDFHVGKETNAVYQHLLGAAKRIRAYMARSSMGTALYCIGSDLLLSYMESRGKGSVRLNSRCKHITPFDFKETVAKCVEKRV